MFHVQLHVLKSTQINTGIKKKKHTQKKNDTTTPDVFIINNMGKGMKFR